MQLAEAAGCVLGAGAVASAFKEGGTWVVVKAVAKTLAAGGAVIAADYYAEQALRAAGAGDQTIRGVRLAVAVVSYIILRRKSGSAGAKPPAETTPAPPSAPKAVAPPTTPKPPASAEVPKAQAGNPTPPSSPHGLKNASGNLDDAARPQPLGTSSGSSGELTLREEGGRGIWDLTPEERWTAVEEFFRKNLPGNFKTIDKFENGTATSIKSLDLGAKSYVNPSNIIRVVRGYIDKMAAYKGGKWGGILIIESYVSNELLYWRA